MGRMPTVPTIASAILKQSLGVGIAAVVSLGLMLVLARSLGVDSFGSYVSTLNAATLLLILIEGGWPTLVYRGLASNDTPLTHQTRMARALGHVMLLTGLLWVVSWLGHGKFASTQWLAAMACMGTVAVMDLVSAHMRGAGRFGLEALWQSTSRISSALAILLAIHWLEALTAAWVFAAWAAGLLVAIALFARQWLVLPRLAGIWQDYPRLLPFVLIAATYTWLLKGDMVLLNVGNPRESSMYAACSRITEAGLLMFTPATNVMFRDFSQLCTSAEPSSRRRAVKLALLWCALAWAGGMLAVALSMSAGTWLIRGLFGPAYEEAAPMLPWVVAMLPFTWTNMTLMQLLTAQHKERWLLMCLSVAGGVLWLTLGDMSARYGGLGAAQSVLLSQGLLAASLLALATATTRRQRC